MTTCQWADSPAIELYFYDELDVPERAEIEAHLRQCPGCAGRLDDMRAIQAALADQVMVAAPAAGDWSGFMRRLDAAVGTPAGARRARWTTAAPWLAAAAALVLAVSGLIVATTRHGAPDRPPLVAADATRSDPAEAGAVDPNRSIVEHSEEHFERSKLVVLGLATRDPNQTRPADWAYERQMAGSLLTDTRLYRLAAQEQGLTSLARVLGDLETVLLETSMSDSHDPDALARVQRLISKRDLMVKMQVVGSTGI